MVPTTGMAVPAPPAMGWVEGMGRTKVRGLGLAAGVARLGEAVGAGAGAGLYPDGLAVPRLGD